MTVWDDVVGQDETVAILDRAVRDPAAMTHAWLLTGPPGSGRSTAARAFAAALQCAEHGCGTCKECRTALDGSHADVTVLATENMQIAVDTARDLVALAARAPSVGRRRVILVEDADRLNDSSGNALLKAIEEPSERTVWVLCAPSLEDVLVTIRSRARHVRLRIPPAKAIADLLHRRDGIEHATALAAARAAQNHIGIARRLARDEGARSRRADTLALAVRIDGVGTAVRGAEQLVAIATAERDSALSERHATEKATLVEQLGADPSARTQPPHVRSRISALEKEQKKRERRFITDVVDRCLVDLLSVYRDALVVQSGAGDIGLVNEDHRQLVDRVALALRPERILAAMDAIGTARERVAANVPPQLALEAMAVSLQLPR